MATSIMHLSHYWAEYLEGSSKDSAEFGLIHKGLEELLYVHFLHWLEVLSLIKAVHMAPQLLTTAAKWMGVCSTLYLAFDHCLRLAYQNLDRRLSTFAIDETRFVTTFQEPMSQS